MRVLLAMSVLFAGVLAGCSEPAPNTPAPNTPAPSAAAPSESSAPAPGTPGAAAGAPEGRCRTDQLTARLDAPAGKTGQVPLSLVYTNKSRRTCLLRGVPGADLQGPQDPNGPVYTLRRQNNGGKDVHLQPGASAKARLVVLTYEDGSVGSMGSTRWVPTRLVTIPPGETTPLTAQWPNGLSVLRQDAATHPGSWIEPFSG